MTATITDHFMQRTLALAKVYSVVILRQGPKWDQPNRDKIIWEHGRRNFQLRADGVLAIVCPVSDAGDVKGIGIFNATVEETNRIMKDDPGVRADVFVYETHLCRGFPGDALPR